MRAFDSFIGERAPSTKANSDERLDVFLSITPPRFWLSLNEPCDLSRGPEYETRTLRDSRIRPALQSRASVGANGFVETPGQKQSPLAAFRSHKNKAVQGRYVKSTTRATSNGLNHLCYTLRIAQQCSIQSPHCPARVDAIFVDRSRPEPRSRSVRHRLTQPEPLLFFGRPRPLRGFLS